MNPREAEESVEALIDDLKFIMGVRPHTEWPAMAEAALDYHDPPIEEKLLTWQSRRLQRAAHQSLHGLVDGNAEQIRAGFLDIRTIENLSEAPACAPEPPAPPKQEAQQVRPRPVSEPRDQESIGTKEEDDADLMPLFPERTGRRN